MTKQSAKIFLLLCLALLTIAQKKGRAQSEQFKDADTHKEQAAQQETIKQEETPESPELTKVDTSDSTGEEPKKPKTIMVPIPQVRGRRYVHNLTDETFDEFVNKKPTIVLVAAEWCPHCKNYIPDFNILAFTMGEDEKYTGEKWATALYYTKGQNVRDPIMKKFDLEAVPRLIMIKDNRYWVYDQDKTLEKISNFVANLNYDLAKYYPSYVPDFVDDVRKFFRDIRKSIDLTMQHHPERFEQFKLLIAVIGLFFGALFFYALLFGSKGDDSDAHKVKKE